MTSLEKLHERVATDPDDGDAWLALADHHFAAGEVASACRAWAQANRLWAGPFVDDRYAGPFTQRIARELRERELFAPTARRYREALIAGAAVAETAFDLGVHLLLGLGWYFGGFVEPSTFAAIEEQIEKRGRERPNDEYVLREGVRVAVLAGRHREALERIDALEGLIGTIGDLHLVREVQRSLASLVDDVGAGRDTTRWQLPSLSQLLDGPRPAPTAAWVASGVDGATAESYLRERVGPTLGLPFARAGVPAQETAAWLRTSREPQVALRWRNAGFDPIEAAAWANRSFAPDDAARWRAVGFGASEASAWSQQLDDPVLATRWRELGSPAAIARWRAAGFSPDEAELWLIVGSDAHAAARWRDAGFDAGQADALKAAGQNPADAARRRAIGFSLDAVIDQARRGVSLDAALVERLHLPSWRPPRGQRGTDIVAFVFWGLLLTERDPPWEIEGDREPDTDQWPERLLRRRGDVAVETLGCCLGRYGRPATWSRLFAAVGESLRWSTEPAGELEPAGVGADWETRLRRFCGVLGLTWNEPGWYLAASLEE